MVPARESRESRKHEGVVLGFSRAGEMQSKKPEGLHAAQGSRGRLVTVLGMTSDSSIHPATNSSGHKPTPYVN